MPKPGRNMGDIHAYRAEKFKEWAEGSTPSTQPPEEDDPSTQPPEEDDQDSQKSQHYQKRYRSKMDELESDSFDSGDSWSNSQLLD